MSKIKNGGLEHYGAGPFEQQQFGTAGVEEVKDSFMKVESRNVNDELILFDIAARVWKLQSFASVWQQMTRLGLCSCNDR